MPEHHIGTVADYDRENQALRLDLRAALAVGDLIHIVGANRQVEEIVATIKVDGTPVAQAPPGAQVGVWCPEQVYIGDEVYLVSDGVAG